jgi:hypothetical protein
MHVVGQKPRDKPDDSVVCAVKGHLLLRYVPVVVVDSKTNTLSEVEIDQNSYKELGLNNLCPANDICVETFLTNLLELRGYTFEKKPAMHSQHKRPIHHVELQSYTKDLIAAIGDNNISALNDLHENQGRHIFACNRFGESTLHIAARKSHSAIVEMILKTEESSLMIDDYGRSPLCDAMWAIAPSMCIMEQLLDKSLDLLFLTDVRGFTPLNYIRKENIFKVCLFLYSKRDEYWPIVDISPSLRELKLPLPLPNTDPDDDNVHLQPRRKRVKK